MSPGVAGLRTLRGEVVGRAVWEPILTAEESTKVRAVLNDPARRARRPARRYLLTGFLYCDLCGTRLITRPNHQRGCYICGSGPGLIGCGKISILADRLEEFVTEAVLHRLDTPALVKALDEIGRDADEEGTLSAIGSDEGQLEELARAYAAKAITMAEWLVARKAIEDRLASHRGRLRRRDRHQALREAAGHGGELRRRWPDMNLDQRRAVVSILLDRIIIRPATRSGRVDLEVGRLEPVWKL